MSIERMCHPNEKVMPIEPLWHEETSEKLDWSKQFKNVNSASSKHFEDAGLIPILMLSDDKVPQSAKPEEWLDKSGPEALGEFLKKQLGDKSKTEYGNELKIEKKQDGTISFSGSAFNLLTFNPKTKTLLDEDGHPSNYKIEAGADGSIVLDRGSQRLTIARNGRMSEIRDLGTEIIQTESPSHGKWQQVTYTPEKRAGWVATFYHKIDGPIELPDGSKATFDKDTVKMTRDGMETIRKFSEEMPFEFTAKDGTKCYIASHPATTGPVVYEIRQPKK